MTMEHTHTLQEDPAPAFSADWDPTDTTLLHPGHLNRTKPLRAWERKPASPFAKQRLRVGKVWKRAFPSARRAPGEGYAMKRMRAGEGAQSPLKVTKRLRMGLDEEVGQRWEKVESPLKRDARIVTRSSAAGGNLVALEDEEDEGVEDAQENEENEEKDVEGTVVEFLDEDGKTLDAQDGDEEDRWDDLDAPDADEAHEDTMMHLVDAADHNAPAVQFSSGVESDATVVETEALNTEPGQEAQLEEAQGDSNDLVPPPSIKDVALTVPSPPAVNPVLPLPAGFVSPIKQGRSVSKRLSALNPNSGRRRTLPQTFAPAESVETTISSEPEAAASTNDVQEAGKDATMAQNLLDEELNEGAENEIPHKKVDHADESSANEEQEADEWQDVSEEEAGSDGDVRPLESSGPDDSGSVAYESPMDMSAGTQAEQEEPAFSPYQWPGLQALTPRKSLKRKSSSPMKTSSLKAFTEASHLLAFSPMKRGSHHPSPPASGQDPQAQAGQADEIMEDAATDPPAVPERAASAPPEEPRVTPRKITKPRISDDTAFIQAFLNRAEESKASRLAAKNTRPRRVSAAKRESVSNRRDSDTVRQALATPAPTEVLGDLDPNSPSPRKAPPTDQPPAQHPATTSPTTKTVAAQEESTQPKARRSIRDRRRPGRTGAATANTIALRGNHDPIVLKRSEAAELGNLTRANTRKNKGASIMPNLRLTKLAAEEPPIEAPPEDAGIPAMKAARNIRWDETLAYYQEASVEPEPQLLELGDSGKGAKLQGSADGPAPEDDEPVPTPVPAAETPSKPKVRKLNPRRTASTPGNPPAPPAEEKKSKTKRSRIATPGKAAAEAALMPPPSSLAPDTSALPKPKAGPRKRVASRLPAPAAASTSTSSFSATGSSAGGEGQGLISSPPKRRTAAPPSSSMSTAASESGVSRFSLSRNKLSALSLGAPALKAEENMTGTGLMSPAKKGHKNVSFGVQGGQGGESEGGEARGRGLGLGVGGGLGIGSSPAKKRTRRTG